METVGTSAAKFFRDSISDLDRCWLRAEEIRVSVRADAKVRLFVVCKAASSSSRGLLSVMVFWGFVSSRSRVFCCGNDFEYFSCFRILNSEV